MKINKITLLLAGTLVAAAAALFTNCTKETATPTLPTVSEETAAGRAVCVVTISTSGALQVCGTQTNQTWCNVFCPSCTNAIGVENVAAGIHSFTLTDAPFFRVTNTSGANVVVRIKTAVSDEMFQLAPGAGRSYSIDGACALAIL